MIHASDANFITDKVFYARYAHVIVPNELRNSIRTELEGYIADIHDAVHRGYYSIFHVPTKYATFFSGNGYEVSSMTELVEDEHEPMSIVSWKNKVALQKVIPKSNGIMNIDINPLYTPIFTTKARYIHMWGGRSRGASHFATDYFLWRLTQPNKYFRGAMLRATMAQITQSLWIALNKRIKTAVDAGYIHPNDLKINSSDHTVTFIPNGNQIICKGFRKTTTSSGADLKGLEGITHAIVEEAEDVFEADFNELDSTFRTTEVKNIQILVLFNPPSKNHWLITNHYDLFPTKYAGWYKAIQKTDFPELLSIHSTYADNLVNVNEGTKRLYRNFGDPNHPKYDPDYFHRSVLGLVSEGRKGRIFVTVKKIRRSLYDELPYEEFDGLDFGFNAPTALSGNKFHNSKLYSRQIVYREGLTIGELAVEMKKSGITKEVKIYADPAEPASIKALQKRGFNVMEAIKGADSIEYGYRELLNVVWYVTDDSKQFWNELEEHTWQLDAEKNPTDTPEDDHNHIIDASRYAYTMHVARKGGKSGINTETGSYEEHKGRRQVDDLLDALGDEAFNVSQGVSEDDIDALYAILYPE